MVVAYQIRLLDTLGVEQVRLTEWEHLEFEHRLNDVGTFALAVYGELSVLDSLGVDWQVEVWRQDLDESIALYLEYEGLVRWQEREVTRQGQSLALIAGLDYKDLLRRRMILYFAGSAETSKTGVGETVMKAYVDENAGPGAISPPRVAAGNFSGFTVEADAAGGSAWTGARAWRNLLEVCREIALDTGIDFQVVGNGAAAFQFQAGVTPLGDDRSTVGLDPATGLNGAGNAPVIFSLVLGNMQAPRYALDRRAEITAVTALGQGQQDDRQVVDRTSGDISDSPWNRIETVRPAGLESTAAGLNAAADVVLEELAARESFTFQPSQIPSLLYGREYFFGDLVTSRFRGIERNFQITSLRIQVSGGQETITVDVANL